MNMGDARVHTLNMEKIFVIFWGLQKIEDEDE